MRWTKIQRLNPLPIEVESINGRTFFFFAPKKCPVGFWENRISYHGSSLRWTSSVHIVHFLKIYGYITTWNYWSNNLFAKAFRIPLGLNDGLHIHCARANKRYHPLIRKEIICLTMLDDKTAVLNEKFDPGLFCIRYYEVRARELPEHSIHSIYL